MLLLAHPIATMTSSRAVARPGDLRALRAWYLVYFAGHYAQNFLPLVFSQVMHFSEAQIGFLIALRRVSTMTFTPLFTGLCDRTLLHRRLLFCGMSAYYAICLVLSTERRFAVVALTLFLREMCSAGADATVNSASVATLAELQESADKGVGEPPPAYGALRLYGSIGWGCMSFLGAVILDAFFRSDMRFILWSQAFMGSIAVFLIARVLNLSPALFAKVAERRAAAVAAVERERTGTSSLLDMDWIAEVTMFSLNVLFVGICGGVLQTSLFLYLTSLSVPNSVLGFAVMGNCAVEAACFHVHSRICARFGGPEAIFRVSILTSTVNLLALASIHLTSNPSLAYVVIMTVSGVSFALFWASAVQICARLAPPGKETSAQGALSTLNWGVGSMIGAVVAGVGMSTIGTPLLYISVAAVQTTVLLLPSGLWAAFTRWKRGPEYSRIENPA